MTAYFTDDYLISSEKQRKKARGIYFIFVALYLAVSVVMVVWYMRLPFRSPTIKVVKWIHYTITVLFIAFSFIYLGIIYKRVNRFYKLCYNMKYGIRETFEGSFLYYDNYVADKDGVDCKSLVFLEWNKYKKNYFERKVYVFNEQPFPEMEEKAVYTFVTQGNVLIEYEKLQNLED